jgi:hypothetical protein
MTCIYVSFEAGVNSCSYAEYRDFKIIYWFDLVERKSLETLPLITYSIVELAAKRTHSMLPSVNHVCANFTSVWWREEAAEPERRASTSPTYRAS